VNIQELSRFKVPSQKQPRSEPRWQVCGVLNRAEVCLTVFYTNLEMFNIDVNNDVHRDVQHNRVVSRFSESLRKRVISQNKAEKWLTVL